MFLMQRICFKFETLKIGFLLSSEDTVKSLWLLESIQGSQIKERIYWALLKVIAVENLLSNIIQFF